MERRRLLKNTFFKCTRISLMMFIALTFAVTLIIKTNGNSFDLIKKTKQLYSENRRDDALVLVTTFKGGFELLHQIENLKPAYQKKHTETDGEWMSLYLRTIIPLASASCDLLRSYLCFSACNKWKFKNSIL